MSTEDNYIWYETEIKLIENTIKAINLLKDGCNKLNEFNKFSKEIKLPMRPVFPAIFFDNIPPQIIKIDDKEFNLTEMEERLKMLNNTLTKLKTQ